MVVRSANIVNFLGIRKSESKTNKNRYNVDKVAYSMYEGCQNEFRFIMLLMVRLDSLLTKGYVLAIAWVKTK